MKYTVDDVVGLGLCDDYPRERVEALWAGRDGLTLREICDLDIPAEDIICIVSALADRRLRVRLARAYAGHVLHIWEAEYPDDSRLGDCLETIDRWLAGEASDEELEAAEAFADGAADIADAEAVTWASWAAQAVAWAVEEAADAEAEGNFVALAASWAAADPEAERNWQLAETKRLLDEYAD